MIDAIKASGLEPSIIVIDTLTRAMPGQDQNSSQAMSTFVGNTARIAEAFDALAIAVHHSGKDASKGMLGSQVLHGATDCEWEVTTES